MQLQQWPHASLPYTKSLLQPELRVEAPLWGRENYLSYFFIPLMLEKNFKVGNDGFINGLASLTAINYQKAAVATRSVLWY